MVRICTDSCVDINKNQIEENNIAVFPLAVILNDKEYMVFTLKVLGDYSFKEISKMKNIPVGTLTWLYQEARKKLEKKLGGQYA